MMSGIFWFLNKFGQLVPDKACIIYRDTVYTYRDLLKKIELLEKKYDSSVISHEVVSLHSDYSFCSIAFFLFLLKKNCIVVPIISTNEQEIRNKLRVARVQKKIWIQNDSIKIIAADLQQPIHPLVEKLIEKKHPGLVLFSSGITGEPKAMLHDMEPFLCNYRRDTVKDINSIIFLTFDHIGGVDTLFRLFSIGGTLTVPENSNPDSICALIEKHKVNVLPCSPTFLNLLLLSEANKRHDLGSLTVIGFGAEPMPESLLIKLRSAFPRVAFQQKFGTTETNAIQVKNLSPDSLYMKIDDPKIEYKIVDEELWLKSKSQIVGYLNSDVPPFENGWFKTGDIVQTRDDGYFKIIGRKKEVINVGGEKVVPGEVENTLLQFPGIQDCLVYGENNFLTGQSVVADVVIDESMHEGDIKKNIRAFCRKKLDVFKVPTKINIVPVIPSTIRFKKQRKIN